MAYAATLYQFLSYAERNNLSPTNYLALMLLALAIGYLATLGATNSRYRIVHCMLGGVFVAHMLVIAIDLHEDPTNHNLLPFEFVMLAIVASPGYVGAKMAQWAERFKKTG